MKSIDQLVHPQFLKMKHLENRIHLHFHMQGTINNFFFSSNESFRDAELRLNLFLSDPMISSQSLSPLRPNNRSDSDSNETTV